MSAVYTMIHLTPKFSSQARLTDSNKNLVARALTIFEELAKAMGAAWERVGRPVLSQTVTFLADNKSQVCHIHLLHPSLCESGLGV
jgi:hypothetical protein